MDDFELCVFDLPIELFDLPIEPIQQNVYHQPIVWTEQNPSHARQDGACERQGAYPRRDGSQVKVSEIKRPDAVEDVDRPHENPQPTHLVLQGKGSSDELCQRHS